MSVDKLVDSTQLDSDLTSVANAIRTRGGTSADLAFPSGFVSAVGAIGNQYAAGDEGKVVSNGELVAQTAHAEVTQNGTIDTTLNNSVTVNVSGKSGTLTFAENTSFKDYTLDIGSDFDFFVIYATSNPLNIVGGRTFGGLFKNFAVSTSFDGLYVASNAGGAAYSGSVGNISQATKSGSVITFHTTDSAKFASGITYQWYAW